MRVSINGRVGGASKKPPENAMKLRESRLSHHLKPTQIMLKRRKIFNVIHNHLTLALAPHTGVLLARIKFYLQTYAPTVIETVLSCFLLNLSFFCYYIISMISCFFAKFCSTLKLILNLPLK